MGNSGANTFGYIAQALQALNQGHQQKREREQGQLNAKVQITAQEVQEADKRMQIDHSSEAIKAFDDARDNYTKSMKELEKFYGGDKIVWGKIRQQFDNLVHPNRPAKPQAAGGQAPPAPAGAPPQPQGGPAPGTPGAQSTAGLSYGAQLARSYQNLQDVKGAQMGAQVAGAQRSAWVDASSTTQEKNTINAENDMQQTLSQVSAGRMTGRDAMIRIMGDAVKANPKDPNAPLQRALEVITYGETTGAFPITKELEETRKRLGDAIVAQKAKTPQRQQYPTGPAGVLAEQAGLAGIPYDQYTDADRQKLAATSKQIREQQAQQRAHITSLIHGRTGKAGGTASNTTLAQKFRARTANDSLNISKDEAEVGRLESLLVSQYSRFDTKTKNDYAAKITNLQNDLKARNDNYIEAYKEIFEGQQPAVEKKTANPPAEPSSSAEPRASDQFATSEAGGIQ